MLLSLVYATTIAVIAGLTARWVARHRRSAATAEVVVLTPEAASAPAAAA